MKKPMRDYLVCTEYNDGIEVNDIMKTYGIARQRVYQLVEQHQRIKPLIEDYCLKWQLPETHKTLMMRFLSIKNLKLVTFTLNYLPLENLAEKPKEFFMNQKNYGSTSYEELSEFFDYIGRKRK